MADSIQIITCEVEGLDGRHQLVVEDNAFHRRPLVLSFGVCARAISRILVHDVIETPPGF